MIKINVITHNINWLKFIKKPNSYIDKRISKINSKTKKKFRNNIFCTLLLSNDKEIKILNKKFRNKNKSTDVLSFPFHKKSILKSIFKEEKEVYLGDIIINLSKINEKKELKNFKKEFDRLWIHGLVHLFGYDHKKKNDFLKMSKVEKKYISFIYD